MEWRFRSKPPSHKCILCIWTGLKLYEKSLLNIYRHHEWFLTNLSSRELYAYIFIYIFNNIQQLIFVPIVIYRLKSYWINKRTVFFKMVQVVQRKYKTHKNHPALKTNPKLGFLKVFLPFLLITSSPYHLITDENMNLVIKFRIILLYSLYCV